MTSSESYILNILTLCKPETIHTYKRLTNINIGDKDIPINIDLSQNLLKQFPSVELSNCQKLKINSNRISHLNFNNYPVLVELNISRNYFQNIDIGFLNNLTYINISNNFIQKISNLPNRLETLICCGNKITELPDIPGTLKVLKCCKNRLASLPDLPNGLISLSCKYNNIRRLPEESLMLSRRLTNLAYDNNPNIIVSELFLRYIDNHFARLRNMETDTNTVKVIYTDAQNVHSTNINTAVLKNLKKILSISMKMALPECIKEFRALDTNNIIVLSTGKKNKQVPSLLEFYNR